MEVSLLSALPLLFLPIFALCSSSELLFYAFSFLCFMRHAGTCFPSCYRKEQRFCSACSNFVTSSFSSVELQHANRVCSSLLAYPRNFARLFSLHLTFSSLHIRLLIGDLRRRVPSASKDEKSSDVFLYV